MTANHYSPLDTLERVRPGVPVIRPLPAGVELTSERVIAICGECGRDITCAALDEICAIARCPAGLAREVA